MQEWIETAGKFLAIILGVFGASKYAQAPLNRRVTALEKRPPARTVTDCDRLMLHCPVASRLNSFAEQIRDEKQWRDKLRAEQVVWMQRLEDKVDRLLERGK